MVRKCHEFDQVFHGYLTSHNPVFQQLLKLINVEPQLNTSQTIVGSVPNGKKVVLSIIGLTGQRLDHFDV